MGAFVLQELRDREMPVRVIVRRVDAVTRSASVEPVQADVYDRAALIRALTGTETVVSAFNPGWNEPDLYEQYGRGARSIQHAAVGAGAKRLLIIGGASSLYDENGRQLIEHGLPPEPYGSGVRAARDYLETIRGEADIDWVFLSPPADCGPVGPTGRTGNYRLGTDHPAVDDAGRNALSREDLAVAVVDEVESSRHHRARFTVGY
jgi:hypothetical protein